MQDSSSRYSPKEAIRIIRGNIRNGETNPTKHFKERLERRNLSMRDIITVLKNGTIKRSPVLDKTHSQWKYRVEGKTIEGSPVTIIVALEKKATTLITCMRGRKK